MRIEIKSYTGSERDKNVNSVQESDVILTTAAFSLTFHANSSHILPDFLLKFFIFNTV